MFEKLKTTKDYYFELEKKLADPDIISDMDKWRDINMEYVGLKDLVDKYMEYEKVKDTIKEDKEMLELSDDKEMSDMLKEEIASLEKKVPSIEEEIKVLLLPKDPNDEKNVFVEIRSGAGGDEAGLFAAELYRMYHMYADSQGFKTEDVEYSD